MLWILGMILAVAIGVWVGIGMPGVKGLRGDRVVKPGTARRLRKQHLDWLKARPRQ